MLEVPESTRLQLARIEQKVDKCLSLIAEQKRPLIGLDQLSPKDFGKTVVIAVIIYHLATGGTLKEILPLLLGLT